MLVRPIVQLTPEEITLQGLSERINSSNVELEGLDSAIQNKKDELDSLDVVMEASKQASISILKEEKAKREQLENVTQELISKKRELDDAKDILLSVENKTLAKEGELIQQEAKVTELAQLATKHEETARIKQIEVSELNAKKEAIEAKIETNKATLADTLVTISVQRSNLEDIENQISNKKANEEFFKDKIASLVVERDALINEVSRQKGIISDLKTAQKGEESLLAEKKQEVFEAEQDLIAFREEKAGVVAMLDTKIAYLNRLKTDIEEKKVIGEL